MADGAQGCGASAPHPCRCHGSSPDAQGDRCRAPSRHRRDTNAPPDGATVGPGRVTEAQNARLRLADEFESVVLAMSEQVPTASTEMSASASGLTEAAWAAATEMGTARETIGSLTRSSAEIKEIIALIDSVAAQTRLLALNATIEAARADDTGKGFAVVASEVKDLADQTRQATERVTAQVEQIRQACEDVASVMGNVGTTVGEMNGLVDGIAAAVDGSASRRRPDRHDRSLADGRAAPF